jgi:hypothetical protein
MSGTPTQRYPSHSLAPHSRWQTLLFAPRTVGADKSPSFWKHPLPHIKSYSRMAHVWTLLGIGSTFCRTGTTIIQNLRPDIPNLLRTSGAHCSGHGSAATRLIFTAEQSDVGWHSQKNHMQGISGGMQSRLPGELMQTVLSCHRLKRNHRFPRRSLPPTAGHSIPS